VSKEKEKEKEKRKAKGVQATKMRCRTKVAGDFK